MADQREIEAALAKVRAGDREAFRDVVHHTAVALRAYVRFFVSDRDAADDVLQEVYLKIFTEIQRYEPGTDFLAWAKSIARADALTARNRLRRGRDNTCRYRQAVFDRVQEAVVEHEGRHPVEDQVLALRQCIERLAEKTRRLVQLHYFERRPLAEAGAELGMKAGTAAVALHRARGALGECIGKGRI